MCLLRTMVGNLHLCLSICQGRVVPFRSWNRPRVLQETICEAKDENNGGGLLFTASHEAIVMITLDSNMDKWTATYNYYKEQGSYTAKVPDPPPKDADGNPQPDPYRDVKYTTTAGGQQKYGSFNDEGINRFFELTKRIRDNRKNQSAKFAKFELDFLAKWNAKLGTTRTTTTTKKRKADDKDNNKKNSKKRKENKQKMSDIWED